MIRFPCRFEPNSGSYWLGTVYGSPVGDASVTLYFGAVDANHPNGHGGLDLACPLGTPIMLLIDGECAEAGYDAVRGNFVRVKHAGDWYSEYLHMTDHAGFAFGQPLPAGTQLGTVGLTGLTTGPHEHWSVISPDGRLYNPLACFDLPTIQPVNLHDYLLNGGAYVDEGESSIIEGTRTVRILYPNPPAPGPVHVP